MDRVSIGMNNTCFTSRHNPSKTGRLDVSFEEIPFVKDEWALRYGGSISLTMEHLLSSRNSDQID